MAYRKRKLAKILFCVFPLLLFSALISGCGGAGSEETATTGTTTPKILSWTPPVSYSDGSSLNPQTDLDSFEIYINQTGMFTDADLPEASLSSHDPGTAYVTTSFDLANLSPSLSQDVVYYVSIRAVSKSGGKSEFSPAASFSI